jgi:hypothetical protein
MRTAALASVFGLLLAAAFASGGKLKLRELDYLPGGPPASMPRVAEGPPDPARKKRIDDLASDDWRTREKAGRELARLGARALPHLRKALLSTDSPEVQRRLSVLVRKMDRERLVEPKRVTLKVKDKAPKEVFDEIARQTGYRIEFGGGPDGKHSFEFENTPFWQAVDAVANAAGLTAIAEYEDDAVRVYNNESSNPYVAYAGPFRLLATNIQSNRNVQLSGISRRGGNSNAHEYLNLSMQIQSEPKNPMLGVTQPELTEAKDEHGGSLLPPRERNVYYGPNYANGNFRGHNTYMSVNLTRGDRAATTIKTLKGRVGVILLAGTVPDVVVADALKAKKKTFVGRTAQIELEGVEEDPNQKGVYKVSFTAKRQGPTDPNRNDDYQWSNSLWQRLELTDEKGQRYFCHGPTTQNNNGLGTVQLVVQFGADDRRTGRPNPAKLGKPAKFTLNEWLTVTHEVNFEFKDIPLP